MARFAVASRYRPHRLLHSLSHAVREHRLGIPSAVRPDRLHGDAGNRQPLALPARSSNEMPRHEYCGCDSRHLVAGEWHASMAVADRRGAVVADESTGLAELVDCSRVEYRPVPLWL